MPTKPSIFVIHKHYATHLHYDLRLEIDGALASWALAKQPPLCTGIKRLAIAVPDHPLSYASFQGVIPAGQYGAGTVTIWDRGTITPLRATPLARQKKTGVIELLFQGSKLKGRYVLVHTRWAGKAARWLFFKAPKHHKELA
jgi:bifunctional non-homologous end joining protein LigD